MTTTEAPARQYAVARGSFAVQLKPQAESGFGQGAANLGRTTFEKSFSGDLAGAGQGEMLSALTLTKGSAGYVAIERVTGTLHGRPGSFVLMHSGRMDRGAQSLTIAVVPDSGSGELVGLEGAMSIRIEAGRHDYEFAYSLPELVK